MAYEADRDVDREPSLAEMTERAIDRLAENDKGYYLMVEGGRIDHAHHATNAYRALRDTQALAKAVESALKKVDLNETLILVTADHSHAFAMAGYPVLGNPILGLVRNTKNSSDETKLSLAADGKPYTTLGYLNGPNVHRTTDEELVESQVLSRDYVQQSAVPLTSGTHSGEDVALYAIGPQAHLVGGVIEQHTIFHIMAHALGWRFE
jgi:alkaline phosphatase